MDFRLKKFNSEFGIWNEAAKKVNLSVYTPGTHVGEWRYRPTLHLFLISALHGGEWSASRSGSFTHGERVTGTHRAAEWVPEPVWTFWRRDKYLA
jgi:hypothetical protein